MNLVSVLGKESPLHHHTLWTDDSWKQTDYFELCSDSAFWGCAVLVRISKALAPTAGMGLSFMLQRIYQETNGFEKGLTEPHTVDQLLDIALAVGFFRSPLGTEIPPKACWKKVQDVMSGILEEENGHLLKNGQQIPTVSLLEEGTIQAAKVFSDDWNGLQCFIETDSAWLLFDWFTMV